MKCPKCGSENIKRYGRAPKSGQAVGPQKVYCNDCHKFGTVKDEVK